MSTAPDEQGISLSGGTQDGRVTVRLAPDSMEAVMTVTPPRGGEAVTVPQAMEALAKAGVLFGTDPAAVELLVLDAVGRQEPLSGVVARGIPGQRGEDAKVEYHELLQTPAGYPKLRVDGSVDHFQLNLVRNVHPGTVLAVKEPPTKGVPGTNVLGAMVQAQDGKDIPLKVGKGCSVTPDGLTVIAEAEGHAVMGADGRINVSPIFEIRGDVDTGTGNIDFLGSVVVLGSVSQGFTVKAGINVEVHGGVDGGIVEAGGDVIVRYGIQGGIRGRVVAGGRIQCRFIENADVRCHRDLVVSDGILHSRVRAGGRIQVTGRRGTIIGGQVKARDEVSSRILGSSLLTATEIEVGVSPEVRDELESVRRAFFEAEEGLRKASQAVSLLRDLEARNPAEFTEARRSTLMKALRSLYQFQGQRDQLAVRRAELEEEMNTTHAGRVRAYDVAYAGVKVTIGKASYHVIDTLHRVSFHLTDQHDITIGPA